MVYELIKTTPQDCFHSLYLRNRNILASLHNALNDTSPIQTLFEGLSEIINVLVPRTSLKNGYSHLLSAKKHEQRGISILGQKIITVDSLLQPYEQNNKLISICIERALNPTEVLEQFTIACNEYKQVDPIAAHKLKSTIKEFFPQYN